MLIDDKGVLKIGDFGLARSFGSPTKVYTHQVVTRWNYFLISWKCKGGKIGDCIKLHACNIHNLTLNKKYVGTCLMVYKLMLDNDPFVSFRVCFLHHIFTVASIYPHMPIRTAEVQQNIYFSFPGLKHFYHSIGMSDNFLALYWCLCVIVSFILLLFYKV